MKKISIFFCLVAQLFGQHAVYLFNTNKISFPINNSGVIADVLPEGGEYPGGYLDSIQFLYSAGFYLTGKVGDTIWSNAIATANRTVDYLPGKVGSSPDDTLNKVYVVLASPPFNNTWLIYQNAVQLGAMFYDGNGDGIYNPIDLNGNGQWDLNEDKPDILGDITAWCVYNDGVPSSERRFSDVFPLGIEVHQTVFAYNNFDVNDPRSSTFFVRYRLINKGTVSQVLDSVYFAAWSDTDLGNYIDDISGCDTILNAGYIYNDGYDDLFGNNPPAHFIQILQGPIVYIPGITFIDNNSNGSYDDGIDVAIDTGYNRKGNVLGIETYPGAKNLSMTSFVSTYKSFIPRMDPRNRIDANLILRGLTISGSTINPCNDPFGVVLGGINCDQINPLFNYSGDPF